MKKTIFYLIIISSFVACKKFVQLTPITEIAWNNTKDSLLVGASDTLSQKIRVTTGEPNNSVNYTFLFLVNNQIQREDEVLFSVSNPSLASVQNINGEIVLKTFKTGIVSITAYAKSNPNVSQSFFVNIYDKDVFIQDQNLRKALFNKGVAIDLNTGIMQLSTALRDSGILNISGQNIANLNGLENFKNIIELDCSNNQIANFNILSQINNLTLLNISRNPITNLDITNNQRLQTLICNNSNLQTLNLAQNTQLIYLICNDNQLTNLNIGSNRNLQVVDVSNNFLTDFDVRQNNNLKNMNCTGNANINVRLTSSQYNQYVSSAKPSFIGGILWTR